MRNELAEAKSESIEKCGTQSGINERLKEQDNTILELKNDQLNLQLVNQQLLKEKEALNLKLNECGLQIHLLKQDIAKRDQFIEQLKQDINILVDEREKTKYVRQQVKQVSDTLEFVQEKEVCFVWLLFNTKF